MLHALPLQQQYQAWKLHAQVAQGRRSKRPSVSVWPAVTLIIIDRVYIALLSASQQTHWAHTRLWMSDCSFTQCVSEYPPNWCTYSAVWLLREAAAISAHILCTPYNQSPVCSVTLLVTATKVVSSQQLTLSVNDNSHCQLRTTHTVSKQLTLSVNNSQTVSQNSHCQLTTHTVS